MLLEAIVSYTFDSKFLYQALATLVTFFSIKTAHFFHVRKKRFELPRSYNIPGPEYSLLDGHHYLFRGQRALFEVDEKLAKRYGRYYMFFIGDHPQLIITDKDLLKKVFLEETGAFKERCHQFLDTSLLHGILFARHDRWKVMRKVMGPAFSAYSVRGDTNTQFIENSLQLMLAYIDSKFSEPENHLPDDNAHPPSRIDIHQLLKATTLHLISAIAVRLPDVRVSEDDRYVRSLDGFMDQDDSPVLNAAIMFPLLRPILQFLADHFEFNATLGTVHRTLDNVLKDTLSKLKGSTMTRDEHVIDTLIRLHHEGRLTREEVIGNADALLFAGYDTTATTLTYVFWVLGKYPDIQAKLHDDIIRSGAESEYLLEVLFETMRLYPTVVSFTTRLATTTVKIEDLTIPQGTKVIYNAWLMHRNPDLWPEPDRFDPSRFKKGVRHHPCAFAPFGLGERKCLGYQLSILEMKTILCEIVLRYRIKLVAPNELQLDSSAFALTKPREKVIVDFERY